MTPLAPTPRRAGLLERESDPGKAEDAIRTQDHALRAEVGRRGDEVRRVFVDAGYSGALPPLERPGIIAMLDAAARGEMDYVLGTEIARANRGEAYAYYFIKHELARCGVELEFLDQTFTDDGESEVGALVEGIQVLLPSIERRAITRRFGRGRKRVADEGFSWVGVPSLGYTYAPGGQKGHTWAKQPAEVSHIIDLFGWAADGWSHSAIARQLAKEGVPTRKGGKWWPSTISGIISNPRYKGEWPIGRWRNVPASRDYKARPERASTGKAGTARRKRNTSSKVLPQSEWQGTVSRPELAIVSPELWQRANDMAQRNLQTSPRNARAPRLLHGLVFCEHDHGEAGPCKMHPRERLDCLPRYQCNWREALGGRHCGTSKRAADLEEPVWELVCDLAVAPERLLEDFIAGYEALQERERRWRALREAAAAVVRKYQDALDNLTLAHYAGEMPRDEYERVRALAEDRLGTARQEHARALSEAGPAGSEVMDAMAEEVLARAARSGGASAARDAIRDAVRATLGAPSRAELDALDDEGRRRKVRQVVEKVVLGPEGASAVLVLGGGAVPLFTDRASGCSVRKTPFRIVLPLRAA